MTTWRPATRSEVESIVAEQLQACSPSQRQLFERYRVEPHSCPIERFGTIEQVYAVARRGKFLLFWEDIEEGFEWSRPEDDGVIRSYGSSQFELTHILYRLQGETG
jgi:hypothetical protein